MKVMTTVPVALAASVAMLASSNLFAQTTRSEEVEQEKAAKAAQVASPVTSPDDSLFGRVASLFMPAPPALELSFGGFRPGAGLAPGVAYVMPVGPDALWTTKAAWSVLNFKLAESTLAFPRLAANRLDIHARVRWENAPQLAFFGLGAATTRGDEAVYGLRSSEARAGADMRLVRWLRFGGALGYLAVTSDDGSGTLPSVGGLFTTASAPGLGSNPSWLHSTAYIGVDTRESPGYTQSGGLYRIAFHDYADRDGRFSFERTEIDLRQFVPLVHDNWIVAMQARANLADSRDDQVIPYFMLPSVGGGDSLRGFSQYRFTDRNTVQLRGELRWTPSSVLDMALFTDRGAVAPRWQGLDLHDLKTAWGIGARLHGANFTALRVEVARGDEGWRYHIAQSVSF